MIQIENDGTSVVRTLIYVKKMADQLSQDKFVYWFIQDVLIEDFAYDRKLHEEFCRKLWYNRIASPAEIYERLKTYVEIH